MKKTLMILALTVLPFVASAHDHDRRVPNVIILSGGIATNNFNLTGVQRAQQELDDRLIGAGASYLATYDENRVNLTLQGHDVEFAEGLCSHDDGMIVEITEIKVGDETVTCE